MIEKGTVPIPLEEKVKGWLLLPDVNVPFTRDAKESALLMQDTI